MGKSTKAFLLQHWWWIRIVLSPFLMFKKIFGFLTGQQDHDEGVNHEKKSESKFDTF